MPTKTSPTYHKIHDLLFDYFLQNIDYTLFFCYIVYLHSCMYKIRATLSPSNCLDNLGDLYRSAIIL